MNANLKISAVLVLITGNLCDGNLVLTRRSEKLRNHGGEISFPGGTKEDLDLDLKETALRETFEEINVTGKQINLIDELPEVSTSTGYLIKPYFGILKEPFEFIKNSSEVSDIIQIPILDLISGDCNRAEALLLENNSIVERPMYSYQQNVIFGATSRIIDNLLLSIKEYC